MYTSSLKPFVINGTDINFLLSQVTFRPLFDANHNAILNWDGTTPIYDGYGNELYTPPVGQLAGSLGALAALADWGTSYQTVVDLSGLRDPSGANNNLAGGLWQFGNADSQFIRLAAPNYTGYVTANTTTSTAYEVSLGGTSHASDGTAITINNIIDGSARTISLLTTTAGVTFATDANGIIYDANGVATVTSWGNLATADEDPVNGLGQVDTQARFIGSAGTGVSTILNPDSATAGANPLNGDHFIGGLNPGVSPSNGFFVLFGQFFDHGLDFIGKGEQGKTIKITLDANDPLYGMIGPDGQPTTSITINRANVATIDANGDAQYVDHTSPFIDQSQTYGSHAQLTTLLREWVQDPVDGQWKAGMNMFDGHTLQTEWKNAFGVMVNDTLPTLNELRAHVSTPGAGRDAITWEDVLDLRNRDENGVVTSGNSGSALILDSNPRFDEQHLHGYHDYNNNGVSDGTEASATAGQVAAVDNAILTLSAEAVNIGGAGSYVNIDPTTHKLTLHLATAPGWWSAAHLPVNGDGSATVDGASALAPWVDFGTFNIMDVPSQTIMTTGAIHDAVSEILMASVGDHYIAGDGRVNENFGLTSIHHVFHEEHNFQVQNFMDSLHREDISSNDLTHTKLHEFQIDTGFTNAAGDFTVGSSTGPIAWDLDKMFQATKLIVEMEYQHAAVDQYARNVTPNIQEFVGYSPDKDPGITLEYAQAAFRFGHSTLRETIDTIDPSHGLTGKIMGFALRSAFLNPDQYAQTGAAATLLGMTHQQMNEVDEFVTPALNQGLLGLPLDLAAINIARGRDLGIPTLNDFREALGLARYSSWTDYGNNLQHPGSLVNFIAAYSFAGDPLAMEKAQAIMGLAEGSILDGEPEAMGFTAELAIQFLDNDAGGTIAGSDGFNHIDTWLGGLAEIHQPGGLLGETFDLVFLTQIESLMDGDRFYYLYRLAGQQFAEEVGNGQLKDIVERNTGLTHLNGNVFGYADKYYDFGAQREVFDVAAGGNTETQTTSNNHKYGDVIDQNGDAVTTGVDANRLGAVNGVGALTYHNTVSKLGNNFQNGGAGVGIYTNSGRSSALDGAIIKIGGVAYVRDTRLEDHGADTGAADLNGGMNLDGTPNSGAESNEIIVGTQYGDLVYAQGGDDTVYGEDGNDIIYGGFGIDRLYGGGGSDRIYGGDNPDLIDGGSGDDFIWGESSGSDINGADQLIGGSGNDFISGGVGIDKLSGGTGDDHIVGDGDTDPFTHGSDGNDLVEGNSGGDILYGDNGDDVLIGGADQDQMFGGNGDDIIRPGDATGALTIGTDEVLGGDGVTDEGTQPGTIGFDLIDFSDNTVRPGGTNFDLGNQLNPAVALNGIPTQVPSSQMEGVIGSAGGDTLIAGSTHLDANGNSVVDNNWLIGGTGSDTLAGGAGDDIIIGGSMRLDDLIGKYNDTYDHNNNNAGLTETDQIEDARYQGASHRVAYNAVIDGSGLIDAANAQTSEADFAKHMTEMLRSDQFKDLKLGDGGNDVGKIDKLILTGALGDYSFEKVNFIDHDGQSHNVIRITDNRPGSPDGSDLVADVELFQFAGNVIHTFLELVPPTASVGNVAVAEGNSGSTNAAFTIALDHAYILPVTVAYTTATGTATADSDFTSTSGSVTIAAGQTSAVVNVAVTGDTVYEANETFNFNLTGATNAAIGTGSATGTITNDDAAPILSINNVTDFEGNSGTTSFTFTVTRTGASDVGSTVHWATGGGTATAGTDYVAASGDLTFDAGDTSKTITVAVNGDTTIEPDATFNVTLSAPTDATISNATGVGTIKDDDFKPLITVSSPTVTEGAQGTTTTLNYVVSLSGPSVNTVTVNYATGAGTATSGTDYVANAGALTFLAGETSKTVSVTVNGDDQLEANETVRLTLSAPTNATVSATTPYGTGTITNDDIYNLINGTNGGETLNGTADPDKITALGGNDTLRGNAGADWMIGGLGNDNYYVDNAGDIVTELAGGGTNDRVFASTSWTLTAGAEIEILSTDNHAGIVSTNFTGNELGNLIYGNAGNNILNGMDGNDRIYGDATASASPGSPDDDTINGGNGNDRLFGGFGDDTFIQNSSDTGRDFIDGGANNAAGDTYQLNGDASVENFDIYAVGGAANSVIRATFSGLQASTEIVVTRNGVVIAELDNIEEIKINTLDTTAQNGDGVVNGGSNGGDNISIHGDFTSPLNTSLAYSTITINGGAGADTVNITDLASANRIVFNTGGGADSVIGDLRPQDVVNGAASAIVQPQESNASLTTSDLYTVMVLPDEAANAGAYGVEDDGHGLSRFDALSHRGWGLDNHYLYML